jgi:rieske iron-sulfur protein
MPCPTQTRRSLLLTTLATGAFLTGGRFAAAQEDQPGSSDRPRKGDLLVFSEGERVGAVITPDDVKLGEPPLHAWPKDPKTSVVRNGSRLNEILVIRLDPGELDEETRSRSADGIVAYSVICTHAGFPVSEWVKAGRRQGHSEMSLSQLRVQPRESAQVVFGPAPTFGRASEADHRRFPDGRWNFCRKGR